MVKYDLTNYFFEWEEEGGLGEYILAFVHNQWVEATKLRTHFKSRLSKNCYKILMFNHLQA